MRRVLVVAAVLGLAAALFLWRSGGDEAVLDAPGDVRACAENLRAIYAGLREYHERSGHLPEARGASFLAALVAEGVWPDTRASRARLACPGSQGSAYAVRDFGAFPMAKFPAGGSELEPLVGCANRRGLDHDGCTNVLYTDGTVLTLELAQEIERGHLPAGARTMVLGPEATIPDLRKLTAE